MKKEFCLLLTVLALIFFNSCGTSGDSEDTFSVRSFEITSTNFFDRAEDVFFVCDNMETEINYSFRYNATISSWVVKLVDDRKM